MTNRVRVTNRVGRASDLTCCGVTNRVRVTNRVSTGHIRRRNYKASVWKFLKSLNCSADINKGSIRGGLKSEREHWNTRLNVNMSMMLTLKSSQ